MHVKISVLMVTHCRSWALPYSLASLATQRRPPDEVVVVLKPCNDGSEEIISRFKEILPLRIIIQNSGGNVTDAYELGYLNTTGDVTLFIDDDAVAHDEWILRYERLFSERLDAGGFTGIVYKAYLDKGHLIKSSEYFYENRSTRGGPHRKPLPELKDYFGWIATSGFIGRRICNDDFCRSVLFTGVNMGFRTSIIKDLSISLLYRGSRKGFWFENIMAYWCVKKGFKTYEVRSEEKSPIVWHIEHSESLTRKRGFWSEFWRYYDVVVTLRRLKKLGAAVSGLRYLLALIIALRKRTLPRLFATLYSLLILILT